MDIFDYFRETIYKFFLSNKNNNIKIDYDKLSKLKYDVIINEKDIYKIEQKKLIEKDCLNIKNAFEKLINEELKSENIINSKKHWYAIQGDRIKINSDTDFTKYYEIKEKCNLDLSKLDQKISQNTGLKFSFDVKRSENSYTPNLVVIPTCFIIKTY
jgi:hypothetical protein